MNTYLELWAADTTVLGEQLGVRCLAQGSHLSRGQFLPEPRFDPTISGYKSDAPSIRADDCPFSLLCGLEAEQCASRAQNDALEAKRSHGMQVVTRCCFKSIILRTRCALRRSVLEPFLFQYSCAMKDNDSLFGFVLSIICCCLITVLYI